VQIRAISGKRRLRCFPWQLGQSVEVSPTRTERRISFCLDQSKGATDDLHSATKAKAAQFQHVVEDAWSDAQSRAQTWQAEIGAYIQQNPTKAVFMALGVGFVVSRKLWK
jgi:ElaB/YqjD/DUF883 family membrane-anchored ribosome-binding protein